MNFPNRAGQPTEENDKILTTELELAGIKVNYIKGLFSKNEVKTGVMGTLHGWSFERACYYWIAKGPGIEVNAAEILHKLHGKTVRVDGHCGCPSPKEWFKGLACGHYHVDSLEGLKALAETIKSIVEDKEDKFKTYVIRHKPTGEFVDLHFNDCSETYNLSNTTLDQANLISQDAFNQGIKDFLQDSDYYNFNGISNLSDFEFVQVKQTRKIL